jgi:hypothetical protein
MSHEARAVIRWVPASRGGRQQPPPSADGYTAPARFESDPQEQRGVWSLRIVRAKPLRGSEVIDANIQFIMPDAPHDILKEGERFELTEGRRVVAKGVVLPSSLASPGQISDFDVALLG